MVSMSSMREWGKGKGKDGTQRVVCYARGAYRRLQSCAPQRRRPSQQDRCASGGGRSLDPRAVCVRCRRRIARLGRASQPGWSMQAAEATAG